MSLPYDYKTQDNQSATELNDKPATRLINQWNTPLEKR